MHHEAVQTHYGDVEIQSEVPGAIETNYGDLEDHQGVRYGDLYVHCKKRLATFPSLAGMSLSKLSPVGTN